MQDSILRHQVFWFILLMILTTGLSAQSNKLVLRDILYQSRDGYNPPTSILADANGGSVIFTVLYRENGGCWETYKLEWAFEEDMSELPLTSSSATFPYELRTFRYSGDCGTIEPWRNPSVILRGHKGHASWLLSQQKPALDTKAELIESRGEHVYFRKDQNVQRDNLPTGYYKGNISVQTEGATDGQFSFIQILLTGNSNTGRKADGLQYEIVYVYEVEASLPKGISSIPAPEEALTENRIQLAPPLIQHNLQDQNGQWYMGVSVEGCVPPRNGTNFQLVVRFTSKDGTPLEAVPGETRFVDINGNAVTGTPMYYLPSYELDLSQYQIWMPYESLNLISTGDTHTVYAHAELYIDGQSIAISKRTPIDILY